VCRSLKTLDKLEEAKEKEKQIESERAALKAATRLPNVLALLLAKVDPFAKLDIPLLPLKVWGD